MRKIKKQKNKLIHFIIFSIILHILLFSFIVFSSLNKVIKLNSGQKTEVINTVMIEPDIVIERYNQPQLKQINTKQNDTNQKEYFQKQEELQKQLNDGEKHFEFEVIKDKNDKYVSKKDSEIKQQSKQIEELSKKIKEQHKTVKETVANRVKIKQGQLIKEQVKAIKVKSKTQTKKEAKITKNQIKAQQQIETKEKTEKTAKMISAKKIDTEKRITTIEDLLSKLIEQQPIAKQQKISIITKMDQSINKINRVSNLDMYNYINKIKTAIQSKFYNADIYHGKICELIIKLTRNGKLISVITKNSIVNDQSFCNVAIRCS